MLGHLRWGVWANLPSKSPLGVEFFVSPPTVSHLGVPGGLVGMEGLRRGIQWRNANPKYQGEHEYVYIYINTYFCMCFIPYIYIYIHVYNIHIIQVQLHIFEGSFNHRLKIGFQPASGSAGTSCFGEDPSAAWFFEPEFCRVPLRGKLEIWERCIKKVWSFCTGQGILTCGKFQEFIVLFLWILGEKTRN